MKVKALILRRFYLGEEGIVAKAYTQVGKITLLYRDPPPYDLLEPFNYVKLELKPLKDLFLVVDYTELKRNYLKFLEWGHFKEYSKVLILLEKISLYDEELFHFTLKFLEDRGKPFLEYLKGLCQLLGIGVPTLKEEELLNYILKNLT